MAMEQFRQRLMRTKTLISQGSFDSDGAPAPLAAGLKKVLTTVDLVSLGVGSCVGTGIYVVAGMVAKNIAGPSTIFSFILAAAASMLSGACYGEFGVRVPKTSGSAYMYSYVAVGEFIAFLTGWNIILEYMIGSAAGASALSACFDALINHSMSTYLEENVGTVIGDSYPDFLGFFICLLMTAVLAYGVQCSARFNNVLNAISLAVWLFIIIVGIFFARGSNWTVFAPHGTSGVFAGAATCFYAFIGFDIIGTTGAEAREPSHSIPRAILVSLLVCLVAYVTVTIVLTLMVPYNEIVADSALLDVFVAVGFPAGKYIVAVGAVASLTVSLLGSMFPMPRVVYAMARDGLLFGFLANIHPFTSTPLIATVITGVLSAAMSLMFSLEMLVQLMSIGTLVAYTLVSLSVLILRYQPDISSQHDIPMKAQLDTISESSETQSDYSGPTSHFKAGKNGELNDSNLLLTPSDDQKSYGTLSFAAPYIESAANKIMAYFEIGWLKLGFPSVDAEPNSNSAQTVIIWVGLLVISELITCITIVFGAEPAGATWAVLLSLIFLATTFMCLFFIMRQPQNKTELKFMAPAVPVLPACASFFNIYLMLKLPPIIWARLAIWLLIGLFMYFGYSMWHSVKERKKNLQQNQPEADQSVAAIYKREKMTYGDGTNGSIKGNYSDTNPFDKMAQAENVIQTQAGKQQQSQAEVYSSSLRYSELAEQQQRYEQTDHRSYNEPSQQAGSKGSNNNGQSYIESIDETRRRWPADETYHVDGRQIEERSFSDDAQRNTRQYSRYTTPTTAAAAAASAASTTANAVPSSQSIYSRTDESQVQRVVSGTRRSSSGSDDGRMADSGRFPPNSIARSRPRPQNRPSSGDLNIKITADVVADRQSEQSSNDLINW